MGNEKNGGRKEQLIIQSIAHRVSDMVRLCYDSCLVDMRVLHSVDEE